MKKIIIQKIIQKRTLQLLATVFFFALFLTNNCFAWNGLSDLEIYSPYTFQGFNSTAYHYVYVHQSGATTSCSNFTNYIIATGTSSIAYVDYIGTTGYQGNGWCGYGTGSETRYLTSDTTWKFNGSTSTLDRIIYSNNWPLLESQSNNYLNISSSTITYSNNNSYANFNFTLKFTVPLPSLYTIYLHTYNINTGKSQTINIITPITTSGNFGVTTPLLENGTYWYYAVTMDNFENRSILASTTPTSITVNNINPLTSTTSLNINTWLWGTSSLYNIPGIEYDSTTSSSSVSNETNCGLNVFCYSKNLIIWAFKPTDTTINKLADIPDQILAKKPFSYISWITQPITRFTQASTTASTSINYTYNLKLGQGTTTLSLLNKEMVDAMPLANNLKTIFGYMVYFATGWYFYKRLQTLEI